MIGAYMQVMSRLEAKLAWCLASTSRECCKKPKLTVILYFLITSCLALGMLTAELETEGVKLWVDQNSEPMDNIKYADNNFAPPTRTNILFVTAKEEGENVLTFETLKEAFEVHMEILSARTINGNGLAELCEVTYGGYCSVSGPLRFWNLSYDAYSFMESSDATVQTTCAQTIYPDGFVIVQSLDFGNYSVNNGLASAQSIRLTYELQNTLSDGTNTEQMEWEDLFIEISTKSRNSISTTCFATKSVDEELAKSVGKDIVLMVIAYTTMITFASLTLGKACSPIYGRALLASTDVMVIIFAAAGAYGLLAFCQIPFTTLTQVLPFILVGVGIDNAYVIVAAFDRTERSHSHPDRMYEAIHEAGMSISVTSGTDFFAFMFASMTKLPALQWFGQYAAASVFFIYTAHITVFPALLTLDTRRMETGRADIMPCIRLRNLAKVADVNDSTRKESETSHASSAEDNLGIFFRDTLSPFLLHPIVKLIVLLMFPAMSAIGLLEATRIENSFDFRLIAPDDSYLQDFYDISDAYYGSINAFTPMGLYIKGVDYTQASVQANIRNLSDFLYSADFVDPSKGRLDWHLAFTAWCNLHPVWSATLSPEGFAVGENFLPALQEFLQDGVFAGFQKSIAWNSSSADSIIATRIWVYQVPGDDTDQSVAVLEAAETFTETSVFGDEAFISSPLFSTYDQYRIIKDETIMSLLLALVAVIVVTAFLLVHPGMVVICVVVVAMVFACILGSLSFVWQISLNAVSCINLLMAISLVVDFCIHVLYTFGNQDHRLSRDERVKETMFLIAPSVFLAITTTFLGTVPLIAASSEVFRVFFKSFVSIVTFGSTFGLIFLPVVLSLIGPSVPRPKHS